MLAAVVWQLRPLILWRWTVRPELLAQGRETRLHVATETQFPEIPAHWMHVEVGSLSFQAPLGEDSRADPRVCAGCSAGCALPLEVGRLTVFAGTGPVDFEDTRDELAADGGDLRILRSRARNWHTLRALADRAQLSHDPPETFRFESEGGKGLVARFFSQEIERFVLYAWSEAGRPAPVLALSQVERSAALALVGSLRIEDGYAGGAASRCSTE
jgi:hypothetical protein